MRGQADASWDLMPKLTRYLQGLDADAALQYEEVTTRDFRVDARAHLPRHLADYVDDDYACWAAMQHYRVPTRLLDWTSSIYVAAYFACNDFYCGEYTRDGAIWIFHLRKLDERMSPGGLDRLPRNAETGGFYKPDAAEDLYWFRTKAQPDRMILQQGSFTVCKQIKADHGVVIGEGAERDSSDIALVIIPAKLKPEFIAQLMAFNVTGKVLFPGLEGIGEFYTLLANLKEHYGGA
jgi:hypothetical protein